MLSVMILALLFFATTVCGFRALISPSLALGASRLRMADVEIVWPNNKKVKVPAGSPMKEAAKKAGFTPNYGCEEGKCGSCELKMNGKQKLRPCITKVPNSATPIKLENP